jgi:hypothetical protein
MSQGSFLQNNKRNKKRFDDGGYEENVKPTKKPKKDFSKQREQKRGEFV